MYAYDLIHISLLFPRRLSQKLLCCAWEYFYLCLCALMWNGLGREIGRLKLERENEKSASVVLAHITASERNLY